MSLPSSRDTKLWLALLHEVDSAGGSASPKDIYPKIQAHFPAITASDLALTNKDGSNTWQNRIQWARQHLVERGLVDGSQHGLWTLSSKGKEWVNKDWKGSSADYSKVDKPQKTSAKSSRPQSAPSVGSQQQVSGVPTLVKSPQGAQLNLLDPVDVLCQHLTHSQRQSSSPQTFEQDLEAAFVMLGFDAHHIGGSGDTDILVQAPLGHATYSAVVDAKSSHSGKITDSQINWPVIANHQGSHKSDFATVVGESFSGGNLPKFANQYGVVLLTTSMVCDLLKLHAAAPFSLTELRSLFSVPGVANDSFKALQEYHNQRLRRWRLVGEIIDTIAKFESVAPNGLKTDHLHLLLSAQTMAISKTPSESPTQQEVTDAVGLLANQALGILAEVAGSGGAFQLTMTADTARKTVRAFARSLDNSTSSIPSAAFKNTIVTG